MTDEGQKSQLPEIRRRTARRDLDSGAEPARKRTFRPIWVAIPALAALFALILIPVILERGWSPADWPNGRGMRSKGGLPLVPQLQIFRKRNGGSERLADGAIANSGDLLQLAYTPGDARFGAIISIDGQGAVTLHYPESLSRETTLRRGVKVMLPNAFRLDDAPRFERFFFITSREKISVALVLDKAKALAGNPQKVMTESLDLPARIKQFSLVLSKGDSR